MKIRKKSKQEQGITLVALVVTIIVLLILAGVTISAVLGENGLVQKAKKATQIHQNAVITENNDMNNASNFINTLANNDSQDDDEDDDIDPTAVITEDSKWWMPTEEEITEMNSGDAPFYGSQMGIKVCEIGATKNSGGLSVLFKGENDYSFWFSNYNHSGSDDSAMGFYNKNSIETFGNMGFLPSEALELLNNEEKFPVWITSVNGVYSKIYKCPVDFKSITIKSPSQTYYSRIKTGLVSAGTGDILTLQYSIGKEVTFGGEKFFILEYSRDMNTVNLLAKYNLNLNSNEQQNEQNSVTESEFCEIGHQEEPYWHNTNWEVDGDYVNTEKATAYNKIKAYAESKSTPNNSISGWFLRKDNVNDYIKEINGQCMNPELRNAVFGYYQNGSVKQDNYLNYWLGDIEDDDTLSYVRNGEFLSVTMNSQVDLKNGIRPVLIDVPVDLIS